MTKEEPVETDEASNMMGEVYSIEFDVRSIHREDHDQLSLFFAKLGKVSMIFRLLAKTSGVTILNPESYLQAANESITLTLVLSWVVTALANPDTLSANPIKDRVGYNNICVGFDSAPAKYVAMLPMGLYTYFGVRYTFTDFQRTAIMVDENPNHPDLVARQTYVAVINLLFCISTLAFPLVLVISPTYNLWMHSVPFLQMIFFQWLAMACNFYEARVFVKEKEWIFFACFTFVVVLFLSLASVDFYAYDQKVANNETGWSVAETKAYESEFKTYSYTSRPLEPAIPWWLMQITDLLWIILQGLTRSMLPDSPFIVSDYHLLTVEEAEALNQNLVKPGVNSSKIVPHSSNVTREEIEPIPQ